jgi:hypothetical protein
MVIMTKSQYRDSIPRENSQIYILFLKYNKYYVGKSNNPHRRFNEHIKGTNGAIWTRLYEPLVGRILPQIITGYDEDFITLFYMQEFGIDKVRGGKYHSEKLSKTEINEIINILNSSSFQNDRLRFINDMRKMHFF